ncbi:MAG: hypothetical protein MI717_07435 [Spirochaetales bacterium]|nr:hypothetical protein [Spirochaetales bacterium]
MGRSLILWTLPLVLIGNLGAQTLQFPDGLEFNDFFALEAKMADGEQYRLFDVSIYEGEEALWPNENGDFGTLRGSAPPEGRKYFFWVRRGGSQGAITYPLSFRRIAQVEFQGVFGGRELDDFQEGVLSFGGESRDVRFRASEDSFEGSFASSTPPLPGYRPARLTLTDGTTQDVFLKSDGFLGGLDEEFGTYSLLWLRHDGVQQLKFQHSGVYSRCPECGAIFYDSERDVCPFDGTPLEQAEQEEP